jgi:hypothetical protein
LARDAQSATIDNRVQFVVGAFLDITLFTNLVIPMPMIAASTPSENPDKEAFSNTVSRAIVRMNTGGA